MTTGPIYPYSPVPGSNAIGSFTIGKSPVGTIAPFNYWTTILSQYANSPRLTALIKNFFQYIDQTKNFDAFYDLIWNVATAQGYGLDVWGRIVVVSRTLSIPDEKFFGFQEQGNTVGTFGQFPFASQQITQNYRLSDDAYRTLIYAKALANICDGSTPAINQILLKLFPNRGNCYVTDVSPSNTNSFSFKESNNETPFGSEPFFNASAQTPNMTIFYVFNFALSPVELAIVQQSGVLPKPTGVAASVVQNVPS